MALGHEKFQIFCSSCHGTTGDGNGITKKYGMIATPSYHDDRFRNMPEGEIFNTITHGKNLMGPYGAKLRYNERWAIVAYVRALQRAQTATINDVPQQNRKELDL
jgi:mono/diheme cytochrome c family protein